ncbi:unnamed protein product [Psylliodes chrysocephalus]|uniref:SCP domain-containing protein n=2 Tax=Psylliodes chrysocephalus TaxID=3402493 RepID=A0A9P0D236_9CUCU|nr:unnamed protein product [Psylliodes chrysocephala]
MEKFGIIVFFVIFSVANAQNQYCRFCKDHLACVRRNGNCGIDSSSCGRNARQISLTNEDIRNIVDQHNSLRNKVATGRQTSQPSASNMNALNYNRELAYIAQCLTNKCKFAHDKCRKTAKYSWVGQNLFIKWFQGTPGNKKDVIRSAIDSFYNEVKDFNPSWINSYNNHGKMVGHYSQLVWANTKEVGCSLTYYIDKGQNTYLMACNYGPGGNFIGQSVYKKGRPASECGRQGVNRRFPGLCGNDNI